MEVQQWIADSVASGHIDHGQTRQETRAEIRMAAKQNQESSKAIVRQIHSAETGISDAIAVASASNNAEHAQTQDQIADIQQALERLSDQIAVRNQQLNDVLDAIGETKDNVKKKKLQESGRVVTSTLLALETMTRHLDVCQVLSQLSS